MKITGSKIFEINIPVIGKCSTRLIRFNIFSNLNPDNACTEQNGLFLLVSK